MNQEPCDIARAFSVCHSTKASNLRSVQLKQEDGRVAFMFEYRKDKRRLPRGWCTGKRVEIDANVLKNALRDMEVIDFPLGALIKEAVVTGASESSFAPEECQLYTQLIQNLELEGY